MQYIWLWLMIMMVIMDLWYMDPKHCEGCSFWLSLRICWACNHTKKHNLTRSTMIKGNITKIKQTNLFLFTLIGNGFLFSSNHLPNTPLYSICNRSPTMRTSCRFQKLIPVDKCTAVVLMCFNVKLQQCWRSVTIVTYTALHSLKLNDSEILKPCAMQVKIYRSRFHPVLWCFAAYDGGTILFTMKLLLSRLPILLIFN